MKLKFAAVAICIGVVSGCAPLDQTPMLVDSKLSTGANLDSVITQATDLGERYVKSAGHSANAAQLVELPILGSAVAAASFLAFGAHPDAALISGIVGATSGGLSSYYQPRKAAAVYAKGAVAAYCMRTAAGQSKINFEYIASNGWQPAMDALGVTKQGVAMQLTHALDDIALQVFQRVLSETEPDIDAIVAKIKTDLALGDSQELKARGLPGTRAMAIGAKPFDPDDPRVQYLIRIDAQITACKTKVGTS